MDNTTKTIVLILVQVLPLAAGYLLKHNGLAREEWGRPLSRFIIWFFNTSVCLLAAWVLPKRIEMVKLPVVAVLFGAAVTAAAILMSRVHRKHGREERGAYIIASCISNYGFTLGGFVCLIFLGEQALSMQTVYIFPLVVFIYLVWLPIGRYYGAAGEKTSAFKSFLMAFRDITTLPLAGTLAGLALNFAGVGRPELLGDVNMVLAYAGTTASTFTVGVTLQLGSVGAFKSENSSMAAIKFIIGPVVGYTLAKALGATQLQTQVAVILSSVPVGLFASFAASIFGLNRNLANSLFVVNTAVYLIVILPVLVAVLTYIR